MAGYDVLGAYDVLGDDMEGDDNVLGYDVLGAQASRGGLARARWARQLRSGAPGAPAVSEMMLPLGLGSVTFTNTSATTQILTAAPQLAFRGERLILVVSRSTGATAEAVVIGDIKVGQRSQLVSAAGLPAEAFGPTAFGVRLAIDPCAPGIITSVSISVSAAPAAGETITVVGTILGRSAG